METGAGTVLFQSAISNTFLETEFRIISPRDADVVCAMAWAAEDLSISPNPIPPPAFWPLPSWQQGALSRKAPVTLEEALPGIKMAGSWVQATDSLPFLPATSPALVPVPQSLGLRFGIFASGLSGQREKVLRVRYYLEGTLWNPYNRGIAMHPGSGASQAFQLVIWNLPQVKVENLSLGISTGWMDMDTATNSATGTSGIHGWIRTPPAIARGGRIAFTEPDLKWQPEGLARTLHPAFMIGPADKVRISFKEKSDGISAACLDSAMANPLKRAKEGAGWFRMESVKVRFPALELGRADDPPKPFHLSGGSLSFRGENAQWQLLLHRPDSSLIEFLDPRRKSINWQLAYEDARGTLIAGQELILAEARNLTQIPVIDFQLQQPNALFSWPAFQWSTFISATDIPQWSNSFRLGSEGALHINKLLDETSFWHQREEKSATVPAHREGMAQQYYREVLPVNVLNADGWQQRLSISATHQDGEDKLFYAGYPNSKASSDYRSWTQHDVQLAARRIVDMIQGQPSQSVSDFFNRGILNTAFQTGESPDPLMELLPLRGWLKEGPPLVRHGSSWVLHLVMKMKGPFHLETRSARIWLLEMRDNQDKAVFEKVYLEWTEPDGHYREVLFES
jgi:hypothetical protein